MSIETMVRPHVKVASPAEAPVELPLENLVQEVQRDSRRDAESYLNETTVPHGGE